MALIQAEKLKMKKLHSFLFKKTLQSQRKNFKKSFQLLFNCYRYLHFDTRPRGTQERPEQK